MLEVGKLYFCPKYSLLLYPDNETVRRATREARVLSQAASSSARDVANAWSVRLSKSVNYCEPLTPFLVLNTDNEYIEVLAGDRKGWICFSDWLKIQRID